MVSKCEVYMTTNTNSQAHMILYDCQSVRVLLNLYQPPSHELYLTETTLEQLHNKMDDSSKALAMKHTPN